MENENSSTITMTAPVQYPAIDWLKLIFAFTIIGIHTGGFAESGLIHQGFGVFSRLAVPGFFAISGFLFFRKPVSMSRYLNYIKRCGILFLVFSAFFFVEFCLVLGNCDASTFFINTLKGGFRHLWFLYALIVGISALSLGVHWIKRKSVIYCIAALLMLLGAFGGTYCSAFGVNVDVEILKLGVVRGFFEAFPALAAGMYLAGRKTSISRKISLPGAVVCFGLLGAEAMFAMKILHVTSTVCWLFAIPCVFFILALGTSLTGWKSRPVIRRITTLIYLVHPAFVVYLDHARYGAPVKELLISPAGTLWEPLASFIWVSLFSLIVVLCVYAASRTRYGKWLNNIM